MRRISAILVTTFICGVLSQALATVTTTSLISITPAPTYPTSGRSQALIGYSYVSQLSGYTSWFCSPGSIWSTVGSYARCCTDDPFVECGIATACLNTSLLVGPGSVQIWTCSGTGYATSCISGTVYDSISGTGSVINIDCYSSWSGGNWDATKVITTSSSRLATTPSALITTSSPPKTAFSSPVITYPPPTTTFASSTIVTLSQTITPPPTTSAPSTSPALSTAAIIAITVGAVFLAVVLILLCVYMYRRHRKAPPSSPDSENTNIQPQARAMTEMAEADSNNLALEMSAESHHEGPYQMDAGARSEVTIFHSIYNGVE